MKIVYCYECKNSNDDDDDDDGLIAQIRNDCFAPQS